MSDLTWPQVANFALMFAFAGYILWLGRLSDGRD